MMNTHKRQRYKKSLTLAIGASMLLVVHIILLHTVASAADLRADMNHDGRVDMNDFELFISAFAVDASGDFNDDAQTNATDLSIMMHEWSGEPSCGDSICDTGEDAQNCSADCQVVIQAYRRYDNTANYPGFHACGSGFRDQIHAVVNWSSNSAARVENAQYTKGSQTHPIYDYKHATGTKHCAYIPLSEEENNLLEGDHDATFTLYNDVSGSSATVDIGPPYCEGQNDGTACKRIFKVLTYNIAGVVRDPENGTDPLWGDHPRRTLRKVADYIKDNDIDVVGLQELLDDSDDDWYGDLDMFAFIRQRLNNIDYPMDARWQDKSTEPAFRGGTLGIGLYSKHPFTAYTAHHLKTEGVGSDYLQEGLINYYGETLALFHDHMHTHKQNNIECYPDVPLFMDTINSRPNATNFLFGDFNTLRTHGCYEGISRTYEDGCLTYDNDTCLVSVMESFHEPHCIDYVFLKRSNDPSFKWSVSKVYSDPNANDDLVISDHRPVYAEYVRYENPSSRSQTAEDISEAPIQGLVAE